MMGPDGVEHDAVEVGFRPDIENFNEYLLDDGTLLRAKNVVVGVYRFDDMKDQDGNPVYVIKANQVVAVSPPEDAQDG